MSDIYTVAPQLIHIHLKMQVSVILHGITNKFRSFTPLLLSLKLIVFIQLHT